MGARMAGVGARVSLRVARNVRVAVNALPYPAPLFGRRDGLGYFKNPS
jgi:hypothetical protein